MQSQRAVQTASRSAQCSSSRLLRFPPLLPAAKSGQSQWLRRPVRYSHDDARSSAEEDRLSDIIGGPTSEPQEPAVLEEAPSRRASKQTPAASNPPTAAWAGLLDSVSAEMETTEAGHIIKKRELAEVTLEQLQFLRPKLNRFRPPPNLTELQRKALRDKYLWGKAFHDVSAGLTVDQLKMLAVQAGIKVQSRPKKKVLVEGLLKKQFGLTEPKEEPPRPLRDFFDRKFDLSRTELFILMVNGAKRLSDLAYTSGARVRPSVTQGEGNEVSFGVIASGSKQVLDESFATALDAYKQSIKSQQVELQMPFDQLNQAAIRYISATSRCSVDMVPGSPTQLKLSAIKTYAFKLAQSMLAALQAEQLQPERPLLSFATPSPLDPEFANDGQDLIPYTFLPHVCASPTSWINDSFLGGISGSATAYRLARANQTSITRVSSGSDLGSEEDKKTLVDLNNFSNASIDAVQSYKRLEEILGLPENDVASKMLPIEGEPQILHSLSFGSLAMPTSSQGVSLTGDSPEHLLLAPLPGTWSLDTAYEWLSNQEKQRQTSSNKTGDDGRMHFVRGPLPGSAFDSQGSFAEDTGRWVDQTLEPKEEEVIRLMYVGAKSTEGGNAKLIVDLKENEASAATEAKPESEESEELDGEADDASAASSRQASSSPRFKVISAQWQLANKEADILCPDLTVDVRLSSTLSSHPLAADQVTDLLQSLPSLQTYVDQLNFIKDSRAAAGEGAYRSSTVPVPIHRQSRPLPPLQLTQASNKTKATLHLQRAERIASTRWTLRKASSLSLPAEEEHSDFPLPELVTETILSDAYQGAKTISRLEWVSSPKEETWRDRLRFAQGIMKEVAIGKKTGDSGF